jgi:hypothetical protein
LEGPSQNIGSVSTPKPGTYCVKPRNLEEINFFNALIVATVSAEADSGAIAEARRGIFTPGCGASGFEVDTFILKANTTTGEITDEPKAEPFTLVIP